MRSFEKLFWSCGNPNTPGYRNPQTDEALGKTEAAPEVLGLTYWRDKDIL